MQFNATPTASLTWTLEAHRRTPKLIPMNVGTTPLLRQIIIRITLNKTLPTPVIISHLNSSNLLNFIDLTILITIIRLVRITHLDMRLTVDVRMDTLLIIQDQEKFYHLDAPLHSATRPSLLSDLRAINTNGYPFLICLCAN